MEDLLAGLIASLSIPALALVFKAALDKWVTGKTKDVIARSSDGKIVSLTVDADSSDIQISDSVRRNLIFEQEVRDTLEKMAAKLNGFTFHESQKVDFIAQFDGLKLAIECKERVPRLNKKSVERYLEAEDGLSKLLLVSREPTPTKVMENAKQYTESGHVSFLSIPSDADLSRKFSRAVLHELKASQPNWQQSQASAP
jgi:hypothetical protein